MTEPAAPAAPANDVEDLFKETDADKTPAAEPADAAPAPGGDVEDLFKDTDDKKAASTEAAPAEPMDQAAPSEVEELFSEPTDKAEQSVMTESVPAPAPAVMPEEVAPQPIAPAESPLRLWTDNTGKYQVWGRLVTVTSTHVRLLKETGKYTTVPFDRLSRSDLAFVRTQSPSVLAGKF
ncbi:MAG TPA: SHD1 domain-containing protein [Pirellulales bacterium]|nr:SHD1 domain-containing protein [Pirellulales bacterium]